MNGFAAAYGAWLMYKDIEDERSGDQAERALRLILGHAPESPAEAHALAFALAASLGAGERSDGRDLTAAQALADWLSGHVQPDSFIASKPKPSLRLVKS